MFTVEESAVACDPKQSAPMTTQSLVGPIFRSAGPRATGPSRRFLTRMLPLLPVFAALAAVAAGSLGASIEHSQSRPVLSGTALFVALSGVLDAASVTATAPPADGAPAPALEDAWAILAQALAPFEAQQSAAEGRPPPMNAPSPLLAVGDARDRALAQAAARYVHAALDMHDLRAAQRAIDLLALRSDSRHLSPAPRRRRRLRSPPSPPPESVPDVLAVR